MTKRTTEREPSEPDSSPAGQESERARAHKKLLEEAIKRPGVWEAMRVFGNRRRPNLVFDPCYGLMRKRRTYINTDHSIPRSGR